jgi:hypothetical protein
MKELREWTPHKGRDLLAIFGESRSGKEFPFLRLLEHNGFERVGPVNMHQFLAELRDVLATLTAPGPSPSPSPKRVLIIDEVAPDDAGRSLLNLMADKKYQPFNKAGEIDFRAHPVVLMSSIEEERLLRDLRGRLRTSITIPPLRDRWQEIPFLIPMSLEQGLMQWTNKPKQLRVPFDVMAALLNHDYRPVAGENGAGLDQQNFRAFEDLLAELYKKSLDHRTADVVELRADALPLQLRRFAGFAGTDRQSFVYTLSGDGKKERAAAPTVSA